MFVFSSFDPMDQLISKASYFDSSFIRLIHNFSKLYVHRL
jgi:hypothetical protein